MTFPTGSGTAIDSRWGPYYTSQPASGPPPAAGTITVPNAPAGTSGLGQASTWENANSELAVENYTAVLVADAQSGSAFVTNAKAVRLSFGGINPAAIQYYSGVNGPTNG